jgi:hypothetical protein
MKELSVFVILIMTGLILPAQDKVKPDHGKTLIGIAAGGSLEQISTITEHLEENLLPAFCLSLPEGLLLTSNRSGLFPSLSGYI